MKSFGDAPQFGQQRRHGKLITSITTYEAIRRAGSSSSRRDFQTERGKICFRLTPIPGVSLSEAALQA